MRDGNTSGNYLFPIDHLKLICEFCKSEVYILDFNNLGKVQNKYQLCDKMFISVTLEPLWTRMVFIKSNSFLRIEILYGVSLWSMLAPFNGVPINAKRRNCKENVL